MEINWGSPAEPNDRLRIQLNDLLPMVGAGEAKVFTIEDFAYLQLDDNFAPSFAGKLLLLRGSDTAPLALARHVYGRYVSSMSGGAAARNFANLASRLKDAAAQFSAGDGFFRPVFFSTPQIGVYGLAISERVYANVVYTFVQDGNALPPHFSIQRWDEFSPELVRRLTARREALAISLQRRPDGFLGLPG